MFSKLRKVFTGFIEKASKKIFYKKELFELIDELELSLIENDVAYEVVEELTSKLRKAIEEKSVHSRKDLLLLLRNIIKSIFEGVEEINILSEAQMHKPYKIVFLGVNGVGKTTTIAKLANMYRDYGFKPLMVAADTFRAGAQEQLRIHGERLGLPVFMGKYGADPAAIVFDAIVFAEKRGYDVLLVDTAGRMHVDIDLVEELKKIVRVSKPHRKILVVDALTGNDAVEQARFFNDAIGLDGVIVTKADAYEQGGVPLSIVYVLRKPILFLGIGQDYKDIKPFNVEDFLDKILPQKLDSV